MRKLTRLSTISMKFPHKDVWNEVTYSIAGLWIGALYSINCFFFNHRGLSLIYRPYFLLSLIYSIAWLNTLGVCI